MKEITEDFIASLPGTVRQMVDLLEQRDLVALQYMVHGLAGTGGGYGFAALTQPARRSEQSIRRCDPFEPVAAQINSLVETIRRIEGYDEVKESSLPRADPK